jgi:hypothetical protein
MSDSVFSLKGKHIGQILHVVGKGTSLHYLNPSNFGEGPVITINEAIQVVQEFNLPNDLYSMQKDGCDGWNVGNLCKGACEMHVPMVTPKDERTTVILQRPGYSQNCLPEYPNKLYMKPTTDLNGVLYDSEMSVVLCVELGRQIMGCSQVVLLCFDSFAGNFTTYGGQTEEQLARNHAYYGYAVQRLRHIFDVHAYPHTIVIPEKEDA